MRLFVAANFDSTLRERLYHAAAPLRVAAPDVAWVAAGRLHTTIKFLGEQDAALVPALAAALRGLLSGTLPIAALLSRYGAFPNFRRARVVWMGIEPAAPLAALASGVDAACSALGVVREARPYRAHMTLGRVKRPLPRTVATRLEQAALARHEVFPWHVGSVDIMHSTLAVHGPTYVTLESIALGRPV